MFGTGSNQPAPIVFGQGVSGWWNFAVEPRPLACSSKMTECGARAATCMDNWAWCGGRCCFCVGAFVMRKRRSQQKTTSALTAPKPSRFNR
ncbi:hypothetical protein BASA81_006322 [Batrachochytrium salamandrivorans]|nr:hypothetical protein BASA81_006322 [Batrachochytrium salamandrivorans]